MKNKEINITMKKINLKGNQGTESYSIEVDRNVLISTLKFNFMIKNSMIDLYHNWIKLLDNKMILSYKSKVTLIWLLITMKKITRDKKIMNDMVNCDEKKTILLIKILWMTWLTAMKKLLVIQRLWTTWLLPLKNFSGD